MPKAETPASSDKTASIVSAIQKLIQSGATEKQIVANLQELGVDSKTAGKLVLLAQADVLTILENEIHRSVDERLDAERTRVLAELEKTRTQIETEAASHVEAALLSQLKEFEQKLENKMVLGQMKAEEEAAKALEISTLARDKTNQQEKRLHNLELGGRPTDNVKTGERASKQLSILLVLVGVVFGMLTIYHFFLTSNAGFTNDRFLTGGLLAGLCVIILYISTLV